MVLFKVFISASSDLERAQEGLEKQMNEWSESLLGTTKIRRTQLASSFRGDQICLVALVNYERENVL